MSALPPFGTAFGDSMSVSRWSDGTWTEPSVEPVADLSMHPASHVFHYGSACFEGLKAHRGLDGTVRIFRLDRHVERMRASARQLRLPVPEASTLTEMITETVVANLSAVPEYPGSLYIRPTLIGTAPNIGAAGAPSASAMLFILTSPVGEYFTGGLRPLRIAVETELPRTTPQFGSVKAGANYAMALGVTMDARDRDDVAQVLFVPGGTVQETGASNILLISDTEVITPALNGAFLEGVTRDSLLALASDLGLKVSERVVTLDDLLSWCDSGEMALAGTAAILAPVGTLVVDGKDVTVGDGQVGESTRTLRQALVDVQIAKTPDHHGWTFPVG